MGVDFPFPEVAAEEGTTQDLEGQAPGGPRSARRSARDMLGPFPPVINHVDIARDPGKIQMDALRSFEASFS